MHGLRAACLALVLLAAGQAAAGCAELTEDPCRVDGGTYHIVLPDEPDGPVPAIVFLHGWGASGGGVLRNEALVSALRDRGYALIAPDGTPRSGGRNGRTWSFHPHRPAARNDVDFLTQVADDAAARHGIDRRRMALAGFSIGGSMTSYLACAQPAAFAAYLPVGGSFWRPHPDACAGPVRLMHAHGWTDTTVPLEGRYVGGGDAAQGDVFHAMEIWREANGCDAMRADDFVTSDTFWWREWVRCDAGAALAFVLFPGGHSVPPGWAELALDWFEALPPPG